jgi:hypothetical protein
MSAYDKAVMVLLLLSIGRLVTVQAVDALFRVDAHLILMYYGVLKPGVALRALAAGPDKIRGRLVGFNLRSGTIDQKSSENQGKGNGNSDEYRAK